MKFNFCLQISCAFFSSIFNLSKKIENENQWKHRQHHKANGNKFHWKNKAMRLKNGVDNVRLDYWQISRSRRNCWNAYLSIENKFHGEWRQFLQQEKLSCQTNTIIALDEYRIIRLSYFTIQTEMIKYYVDLANRYSL